MWMVDQKINDIVHRIFRNVKHFSKAEILGAGHKSKLSEYQAQRKRLEQDYAKAEKDLQGLKAEIIKVVNGESAFPTTLLSSLIQETEQRCAELKQSYLAAKAQVEASEADLKQMAAKYDQLIHWSEVYDSASLEAKKMIVAQLIERVDVFREYRLQVKFTISVEPFLLGLDIPV